MLYWTLLVVASLWVLLDLVAIIVKWRSIDTFYRVFESRVMVWVFSVLNLLLAITVIVNWIHIIIQTR